MSADVFPSSTLTSAHSVLFSFDSSAVTSARNTADMAATNSRRPTGLSEDELAAAITDAYWAERRRRHWEDVQRGLAKLDGTRRARIALRTGLPPERLDELGGIGE
jgi:hypothetical protein